MAFNIKKWFGGASTASHPDVQNYLSSFENTFKKHTPTRDLTFVVLDTETTGLNYKTDKLLSLAAVKIQNKQIRLDDRLEFFIYQDTYLPDESIKIHGILAQHSKSGLPEPEALVQFLNFVADGVIVGHHIGFDIACLNQALGRHFGLKLKNKTLDTAHLEKRVTEQLLPYQTSPVPAKSLDELCDKYQIPLGKRHTAAEDTFITAILFLKLLGRLEKRGIDTWRELAR